MCHAVGAGIAELLLESLLDLLEALVDLLEFRDDFTLESLESLHDEVDLLASLVGEGAIDGAEVRLAFVLKVKHQLKWRHL